MAKLNRPKKETKDFVEQVAETSKKAVKKPPPLKMDKLVSTGSTLLDLAISGKRVHGGGIPGGLIVEIFGPPGSGKTAVLAEICASAQNRGGDVRFLDPEARLDKEYSRIYGLDLKEGDYHKPDLVEEMFNQYIRPWKPSNPKEINVIAADSLAALSTELEMSEKGDKYGWKRAKEFSEGLRKTGRIIENRNWLFVGTNQLREGDKGEFTPGGKGFPFWSTLRIRVAQIDKIAKKKTLKFKSEKEGEKGKEKEIEKVTAIISRCKIIKSTVDDPYRECIITIVFGYGIDSVRDNLQYVKDMTGSSTYDCVNRNYHHMDKAVEYIEENNLQKELEEKVIHIWNETEKLFETNRQPKIRK